MENIFIKQSNKLAFDGTKEDIKSKLTEVVKAHIHGDVVSGLSYAWQSDNLILALNFSILLLITNN